MIENQHNKSFLKKIFGTDRKFFSNNSISELIMWVLIIFAVRTFIFGLYQVPSGSAETTMLIGESFVADKLTYWFRTPRRGEIISLNDVTFKYSTNPIKRWWQNYVWGPTNVTKRLIAIPGDVIEGKIEDGKTAVYLNGKKLDEPYLNQYPLVGVYGLDPKERAREVERENFKYVRNGDLTIDELQNKSSEFAIRQALESMRWKTYDPSKPFNKQPFYNLEEKLLIRNAKGKLELRWPGTPLPRHKECEKGKNYWTRSDKSYDEFYIELGPNQYWGMGDNREGSYDCRAFGPINGSLIHGKMVFRIFSVDSGYSWMIFHLLLHPIDFIKRIRWSRCLQFVR